MLLFLCVPLDFLKIHGHDGCDFAVHLLNLDILTHSLPTSLHLPLFLRTLIPLVHDVRPYQVGTPHMPWTLSSHNQD
jgi:hypothetical protein